MVRPMPVRACGAASEMPAPSSSTASSKVSAPFPSSETRIGPDPVRIGIFQGVDNELGHDHADRYGAVGVDRDVVRPEHQLGPDALAARGGPDVVDEALQVGGEGHALHVVRGIKATMHLRHGLDAARRRR